MRALIVVESMLGNTKAVAGAIAKGLAPGISADVINVAEADTWLPEDIDLLIVGAPTHVHGLSRLGTRNAAIKTAGGLPSPAMGVREWMQRLTRRPGLAVATLDTRIGKPRWMTGSAAKVAARRLGRLGFRLIAPPESFFVHGAPAELDPGELSRARLWGESVSASFAAAAPKQEAS